MTFKAKKLLFGFITFDYNCFNILLSISALDYTKSYWVVFETRKLSSNLYDYE